MTKVEWRTVGVEKRRFRTLVHEGSWTSSLTALYRDEACTGVVWSVERRRSSKPYDVTCLLGLPGLAYLELKVNAADDSPVGSIPSLEVLNLLTRSTAPLDLSGLRELRQAGIDDRDGLVALPGSLERLGLAFSTRRDLRWLEGSTQLQSLKLEGTGQRLTLAGMPSLPVLQRLYLDQVLVETGELLDLPSLAHVNIYADQPGDVVFDAVAFSGCQRLKTLRISGPAEIRGLAELAVLLPDLHVAV